MTVSNMLIQCARGCVIALIFAPLGQVAAHHSRANFEMDKATELTGTITEYRWRNPHAAAKLMTTDESGQSIEWLLELPSINSMRAFGWKRDTLSVGDQVIVVGNRDRDYDKLFLYTNFVVLEDGTEMLTSRPNGPGFERLTRPPKEFSMPDGMPTGPLPVADSIFGNWLKVRPSTRGGGGDGGTRHLLAGVPGAANLPVTEAGRAAAEKFTEDDNPEFFCIAPTIPSSLERSFIRIDRVGDEIHFSHEYMDGRWKAYLNAEDAPTETSHHGVSIAKLEDGILSIETTNFSDNAWGNGRGIPSGSQKRVLSRFSLLDEHTLRYEFTLEDPEYLLEPVTGYQNFLSQASKELPAYNCDPESSSIHLDHTP